MKARAEIHSNTARVSPPCIDLAARFGRDYRVIREESYEAERPENRNGERVWLLVIPGRLGHVSPWDETQLLACTYCAGKTAKLLRRLPYAIVWQDGDDGANFIFPVEKFPEVAAILRLRRRRKLSPAARRLLVEAGAKTRFQHGAGGDCKAQISLPRPRDDSQVVQPQRTRFSARETYANAGADQGAADQPTIIGMGLRVPAGVLYQ